MTTVPLTVAARNEAQAIGVCLDSLLAAARHAEERLPVRLDIVVVLDECTDQTEAVVRARGVPCVASRGGKVEAQRAGCRSAPFQIFSDADIIVAEDTLHALCRVMLADARVAVAFPPKAPLPPRRRTPLAWALHIYNRRRGFSSQRAWFSGKLFAIRQWEMPTADEVARRARALPPSRFYEYGARLAVDDIYLSRRALLASGLGSLHETDRGEVRFRAPETWRGMYRYYRRMRRELERLEALFPEMRDAPKEHRTRRADLLAAAPLSEKCAFGLFQAALCGCRISYCLERVGVERLGVTARQPWPPIPETKAL